jgi:hypothetical protein
MFDKSCRLLVMLGKSLKCALKEPHTTEAGKFYGLRNIDEDLCLLNLKGLIISNYMLRNMNSSMTESFESCVMLNMKI